MGDEFGGNVFASCDDVSGLGDHSGFINNTFRAPSASGIYYITQISTWWYTCPAPNFNDPPQIPIHNNGPNAAIAVIVVNVANDSISAITTADVASAAGNYPITLLACNQYNPNYAVTLQDGTLTVGTILGRTSADIKMENKKGKTSLAPNLNPNTGVTSKVKLYPNTLISLIDKLYPNPGSALVRLELIEDVQQTGDIQLYDIIGKINRILVRRINAKIYEFDVSELSRGIYFMKVKTSGGLKTFRFVKM
jgi:hypothetical protein